MIRWFVIVGATGDLASGKLLSAIARHGQDPQQRYDLFMRAP